MKMFNKILALTMAVVAFTFLVNAQSFSGDKQKSIEQQAYKKISGLPDYGVFDHIVIEVRGNTVILSGQVLSLGTKGSAANVVERIPGVERVVNNIESLNSSSFDNAIRRQVYRRIVSSPALGGYLQEPDPSVRIIVNNGRVTLEGYVNNSSTANSMTILANSVSNVFGVTNNLKVGKAY